MALPHDPLWPRAGGWPRSRRLDGERMLVILGVPAWRTSLSPTGAHATPAAVREALRRYSPTLIGPPPIDLGRALRSPTPATSPSPTGRRARPPCARSCARARAPRAGSSSRSAATTPPRTRVAQGAGARGPHHARRALRPARRRLQRLAGAPARRGRPRPAAHRADRHRGLRQLRRLRAARRRLRHHRRRRSTTCAAAARRCHGARRSRSPERAAARVHLDIDVDVCDRSVAPGCPASRARRARGVGAAGARAGRGIRSPRRAAPTSSRSMPRPTRRMGAPCVSPRCACSNCWQEGGRAHDRLALVRHAKSDWGDPRSTITTARSNDRGCGTRRSWRSAWPRRLPPRGDPVEHRAARAHDGGVLRRGARGRRRARRRALRRAGVARCWRRPPRAGASSVMVVAHDPGMSVLAGQLSAARSSTCRPAPSRRSRGTPTTGPCATASTPTRLDVRHAALIAQAVADASLRPGQRSARRPSRPRAPAGRPAGRPGARASARRAARGRRAARARSTPTSSRRSAAPRRPSPPTPPRPASSPSRAPRGRS